jgi:dCTP diphosphatase
MRSLIRSIRKFNRERDWDQYHSPKNLAMALAVKTAEIMEHFQWLTEEQSRSLPAEKLNELASEIGDVLIYLTNLADKLGIDPMAAARAKLETKQRKYPADRVRGTSLRLSK